MKIIRRSVIAAVLAVGLAGVATHAQDAADASAFEGVWGGALQAGQQSLRLKLEVSQGDDGLQATLTSVDQGGAVIPSGSASIEDGRLKADYPMISGALDVGLEGDDELTGTWTQGPGTLPITFARGEDFE
jgi:hypothetical protein